MFKQYRINKIKCKIAKYKTILMRYTQIEILHGKDYVSGIPRSMMDEFISLEGKVAYLEKKLEILEDKND